MDESSGREIRRLRSIFWSERDPDGRAFPTLADAYRRAGDLDQALELLTDGLDRHPDFATGHVVAAWVHRDRDDLPSAETAFRHVLDLDEENVQALHGLGRILVVRGEVEEAQRLLTRAAELGAATEADLAAGAIPSEEEEVEVSVDEEIPVERFPTDTGAAPPTAVGDALEALPHTGMEPSSLEPGALEVGAGPAPPAEETAEEASGATADASAGEDLEPQAIEIDALAPDELAAEEDEAALPPEAGPADLDVVEIADLAPDAPAAVEEEEGPEAIDIDALAPDEAPPAVEEEEELEAIDIDALAPAEPPPVVEEEGPEPIDIDALAPDEPPVADPADEGSEPIEIGSLAPDETESIDIRGLAQDEDEPEPIDVDSLAPDESLPEEGPAEAPEPELVEATGPGVDEPVEDHAWARDESPGEEEPVVAVGAEAFRAAANEPYEGPRTRTMAELYARQGLLDRAVDIYEHLVRERPEDREVRSRLDELRARKRGDQPSLEEDVEAMAREMSAGDHAESTPSPFTWAEEGRTGGGEALEDAEPEAEQPVSEWFEELLAWRPAARPQEDEPPPHGDALDLPGEDR